MDTTLKNLVERLQKEGGKLSTTNHFDDVQIAFHRSQGNMAVDDNGIGYIFVSDKKKNDNSIKSN